MPQRNFKDLTDQTFHNLMVFARADNDVHGRARWWCRCVCGMEKIILGAHLRRAAVRSCGCWKASQVKKRLTKHGMRQLPEYKIYASLKSRCSNPHNRGFRYYGGRGITVEWKTFEDFYQIMGPRPSPKHTIERRDNNLAYSAENCYWATRLEQANNKRNNHSITFLGRTQNIGQWAKDLNISQSTLSWRINHWSLERALTQQKIV